MNLRGICCRSGVRPNVIETTSVPSKFRSCDERVSSNDAVDQAASRDLVVWFVKRSLARLRTHPTVWEEKVIWNSRGY